MEMDSKAKDQTWKELTYLRGALHILAEELGFPTNTFESEGFKEAADRVLKCLKKFPVAYCISSFINRTSDQTTAVMLSNVITALQRAFITEHKYIEAGLSMDMPLGSSKPPLILVSLPLAGATLLFTLLNLDPNARTVRRWEVECSPAEMFSMNQQQQLDAYRFFLSCHDQSPAYAHEIVECRNVMMMALGISTFTGYSHNVDVKMFARWSVRKENVTTQMEFAKRFCQLLDTFPDISSSYYPMIQREEQHWVLSDSSYLPHLLIMARLYPGACFIWVHRNVKYTLGYRSTSAIIPSFNRRGGGSKGRQHRVERTNSSVVNEATMAYAKEGLEARALLSSSNPITDCYFEDILDDPVTVVKRLYSVLRRGEVSAEYEQAIKTWWEKNEDTVRQDFARDVATSDINLANESMKEYLERFPKAKAV